MARRLRQPNHRLAALIAEAGFSKKGLAARVIRAGELRGHRDLKFNHSSVERWLRGDRPRPPTPDLLTEVLSAALGRPVTLTDLGMPRDQQSADTALHMQPTTVQTARVTHGLAESDLEQRKVLLGAGFDLTAFSSAALRWLVSPRIAINGSNGNRRIGAADILAIREAIQAFRVLDNRLGGGRIRPTVVSYLHADIAPLLSDARCTDHVRRQLFSAAAELSQLCGWQAHDLEMQGLAQRYLVQALSMARFAQDESLGGEILAAMSQQAVYVAQADQAIDMAQAAQAAARRAGLKVLQTEAIVMEAHGHALAQDSDTCAHTLRRAETVFGQATTADVPPWLGYFDQAYFAAKIAHCFRALEQGRLAEKYALRSLDMNPDYVRGKAFNVALLAMSYTLQGEVEQACTRGRQAVDLARNLDSARALSYVRDLLRTLKPYATSQGVGEFREYAGVRLPELRRT
jgi:tetratricopeptide (TPR) repeat protein